MIATTSTMQVRKIPFSEIEQLSKTDQAYAQNDPKLRPFYKYLPHLESFAEVIADKAKANINRELLVSVLEEQYAKYEQSEVLQKNIAALGSPNTFTVVTAHQPSLFTGPLYYIYKIVTTLNLAKRLAERYPEYHFVPVFVTGGEDHDFEEINHAHIFGNRLEWQSGETGSVGMMSTRKLDTVLAELKEILGTNDRATKIYGEIAAAYEGNDYYSAATVDLVNRIFGERGLVVLNMNNARLKREFTPHLRKELFEQPSHALIEKAHARLDELGFKAQATPREINLFYLADQIRERIVWEEEKFKVLNTELAFSQAEMEAELEAHPERFSPNVVVRPLYQEAILPNLAYVGGGGELAYWLERKEQFAHFGINFPVLMRRNSAMWIDKGNAKKREKLEFSIAELFQPTEDLVKLYVQRNASEEWDFSKEKAAMKNIFAAYKETAAKVDPTLVKAFSAEEVKQGKVLDQLESRIQRAEKQKHETSLNQLRNLKEKLFPNNGLQERTDNFISFYLKHGDDFIAELIEHFDPFDPSFVVLEEG